MCKILEAKTPTLNCQAFSLPLHNPTPLAALLRASVPGPGRGAVPELGVEA